MLLWKVRQNHQENSEYRQAFQYYECALNILLQAKEPVSLDIRSISEKLVEICSNEIQPDISVMLKYQIIAHEHLIVAHSSFSQQWQRNSLAASYEKLADLCYDASNQSDIALEHRLSAAELRKGPQESPA